MSTKANNSDDELKALEERLRILRAQKKALLTKQKSPEFHVAPDFETPPVENYMPLLTRVARKWSVRSSTNSFEDFLSAAFLGFKDAFDRWDWHTKGKKGFVAYAYSFMTSECNRLARSSSHWYLKDCHASLGKTRREAAPKMETFWDGPPEGKAAVSPRRRIPFSQTSSIWEVEEVSPEKRAEISDILDYLLECIDNEQDKTLLRMRFEFGFTMTEMLEDLQLEVAFSERYNLLYLPLLRARLRKLRLTNDNYDKFPSLAHYMCSLHPELDVVEDDGSEIC